MMQVLYSQCELVWQMQEQMKETCETIIIIDDTLKKIFLLQKFDLFHCQTQALHWHCNRLWLGSVKTIHLQTHQPLASFW